MEAAKKGTDTLYGLETTRAVPAIEKVCVRGRGKVGETEEKRVNDGGEVDEETGMIDKERREV